VLLLTGLRDALVTGTEILVHNESRDEVYPVRHGLSARQVQMLLPGGLIPWLRDRRAQDAQMNSNQSLP
jgi:aconitate hydratase